MYEGPAGHRMMCKQKRIRLLGIVERVEMLDRLHSCRPARRGSSTPTASRAPLTNLNNVANLEGHIEGKVSSFTLFPCQKSCIVQALVQSQAVRLAERETPHQVLESFAPTFFLFSK